MTTRVDYHTETATEFLAKAHTYLAEGDRLQASEKGWGATAHMVKAVAEDRGWRHASHRDLYQVIGRLVEETSDEQLRILFRSASALHQNFYEGRMDDGDVADGLADVEEIVRRLSAVIN